MATTTNSAPLSLYRLLDPEVLADPYPLYRELRESDPVHWDPFLHAWVVTRYQDVITVLREFSADRTPSPEQFTAMGLAKLSPIANVMTKQMLFLDAPAHARLRGLASLAFMPARVEAMRAHIQQIADKLLDACISKGEMDIIADFASPFPAIVTAEMLGVRIEDHLQLKAWSACFAELLGNFQHNPDRANDMLRTVEDMTAYFRRAICELRKYPREGLIQALLTTEIQGDHLSDEEVIANSIITMVGGQETTTNLIGNGLLTLLNHPLDAERLRNGGALIKSAVEELLRYESPSQHTARLAPSDTNLGGKQIKQRQAVIAVMGAGNRDPERFPDPDRLDLERKGNHHLAFGWAAHFCFGAALARIEGQIAFATILRRLPNLALKPGKLTWRFNLGLRGLTALPVSFQKGRAVTTEPVAAVAGAGRVSQSVELTKAERSRLAKYLGGLRLETCSGPIRHQPSEIPAPLSVSQKEIWHLAQQPELPPLFNESVTIHRHGALQVKALERAFSEVIRRHEAWRTTFEVLDGELVQVVHAASPVALPVTDLREFPEAVRQDCAIEAASGNAREPFDLSRGPLVRTKLVRLGDEEYRLFLTVHMIVLDGVSIYHVLLPELRALYDAFVVGGPSPLPDLPIQVSDFARWQKSWLQGERTTAQVAYWKKQLAGDPPSLQWPSCTRPLQQTFRGAIAPFTLSGELAAKARELCSSEGVTLFAMLTAIFACLLHGRTGQEDLMIGTFSPSGRKRSEVKNLLGYFLNPVPLRLNPHSDQTFEQLLFQVRKVSSEAFTNDDVSFEQLVAMLQPKADPSRNPFFQVAISHDPPPLDVGSEWDVTPMDVNSGGARWDLYMAFDVREDRIHVRAQYNPDIFARGTIDQLVSDFSQLLNAASVSPKQTLGELLSTCNLRCAA